MVLNPPTKARQMSKQPKPRSTTPHLPVREAERRAALIAQVQRATRQRRRSRMLTRRAA